MIINKKIGDEVIIISDEIEYLRKISDSNIPFLLIISEEKLDLYSDDISFAPYIYLMDSMNINPSDIDEFIEEDYLRLVISRFKNIPLMIANSNRIYIRELTLDDADSLIDLYKNEKYIESFFDNKMDAKEYLKKYIADVYGFWGFGIWGIFSNSELYGNKNEFMGVTGFTKRDDGIELCYALLEKYRLKNLAYEATMLVIDYADRNIDYDKIIINVHKTNTASVRLAKKIQESRLKIDLRFL